jgi:hypothetical protein
MKMTNGKKLKKPKILRTKLARERKASALYDSPTTDLMGKDKTRTASKQKAIREILKNQYQLRGLSNKLRQKMKEDGVPSATQKTRLEALRRANKTIQDLPPAVGVSFTIGPVKQKINKDLAVAFGNKSGRTPKFLKVE